MKDTVRTCLLKEIDNIILSEDSRAFCLKQPVINLEFDGDIDYLCCDHNARSIEAAIMSHLQNRGLIFKIVSHVSNRKVMNKKFVIHCAGESVLPLQVDINYSIHWLFFDIVSCADTVFVEAKAGSSRLYNNVKTAKNFLYKSDLSNFKDIGSTPIHYFDFVGVHELRLRHKLKFAFRNLNFTARSALFFIVNAFKQLRENSRNSRVLAFYGPDGAGKSSLINGVKDSSWVRVLYDEITICHTRPAIIPSISTLLKGVRGQEIKPRPQRSIDNLPTWKCYLLFFYYCVDYFLFKAKTLLPLKRKKELFIFDRYFLDFVYQQTFMNLPSALVLFVHKFIATQTIEIFVEGDPEIIESRKNELTADQIKSQIETFKNSVGGLAADGSIRFLDNTGITLQANIENIEKFVWERT